MAQLYNPRYFQKLTGKFICAGKLIDAELLVTLSNQEPGFAVNEAFLICNHARVCCLCGQAYDAAQSEITSGI
jgi:hypothetical protein